MDYNRAAMKEEVKQAMRRTRPSPMLVTLLFLVVVSVGSGLISQLSSRLTSTLLSSSVGMSLEELFEGIMNYGDVYIQYYFEQVLTPQFIIGVAAQAVIISFAVSILTTIWTGLMDAGYAGYCLDMSRGTNPDLGRIFCGFPRAGSVILAYILVAIFTALWSMLFSLGLIVLFFIAAVLMTIGGGMAVLGLLLMLAAYVGFFIGLIWAVLRYAMVPFAVIDPQNNLSAMDAIRASKTLMKGRKGKYFVLQLSFIGWYWLRAMIAVVGFIIVAAVTVGSIFSYADRFEDVLYSFVVLGNPDELLQFLVQMLGPVLIVGLIVVLVCGVSSLILNLWLTPYRTGCNARFYVYAMGGQPIQPNGGQPGPYSGGQYNYGSGQASYGGGQYNYSGGQPGQPYGGQPGPYSGYRQAEQPPQHGAGTYPQWGVPQATAYSTAEPFAPPAAPVFPQAPQFPQAPAAPTVPQTPQAPTYSAAEPFAPPAAPVFPQAPQIPQTPAAPTVPQTPQTPAYSAAEPFAAPAAPATPQAPQFPQEPAAPTAPQIPQAPAYPAAESFVPPAAPVFPQAPQAPAAPVIPAAPVFSAAEPPVTPAAPEAPASPEPVTEPMPAEGYEGPQFSPEDAGAVPDLPLDATVVFTSPNKKPKDGQQEKPDGPIYPQY